MDAAAHPSAKVMNSTRYSLPMLAEAATALDAAGYNVFSTMLQKPYVVRQYSLQSGSYWAFDHEFTAQALADGPVMQVGWSTEQPREQGRYGVLFRDAPDGRLSWDSARQLKEKEAVVESADVFFKGENPSDCPALLGNSGYAIPRWIEKQRDIFMAAAAR